MNEWQGELGRGSYSVVFKARSRDDRRIYAIKKATKRIKNRSKRLAELKTVEAVGDRLRKKERKTVQKEKKIVQEW